MGAIGDMLGGGFSEAGQLGFEVSGWFCARFLRNRLAENFENVGGIEGGAAVRLENEDWHAVDGGKEFAIGGGSFGAKLHLKQAKVAARGSPLPHSEGSGGGGFAAFDLGELVVSIYIVSILFVAIVLGGFLKLCGFNIFRVLSYFKDEILFVFAATSAETMMPRSMQKLEKLGVSREVVGLVMPGGFSFNMDGTAIYMTMSVLFLAHAFNVELTIWHQLAVLFVMLFTSKGAAGVTGGGFVALAAILTVVNAVPVAGLALLLGVDRFMAEIRAATNLTSNIIATLVVGRWVGAIDMDVAKAEFATGFVETDETRAWENPHAEMQAAE